MPQYLEPKLDVLPAAQKQIWPSLAPAPHSDFVLYGGTAIALHLGHRESLDFDFFRSGSLDKDEIRAKFQFVRTAAVLQDSPDTLVILAETPAGSVHSSAASASVALIIRSRPATVHCWLHLSTI